jgi:hypothetical protein
MSLVAPPSALLKTTKMAHQDPHLQAQDLEWCPPLGCCLETMTGRDISPSSGQTHVGAQGPSPGHVTDEQSL